MINNKLGVKIASFSILLLFVTGCYDKISSPYLISAFPYSVQIEIKISGSKLTKTNFYPGVLLAARRSDQKYEEIHVYKNGTLLFEYFNNDLDQLLRENKNKTVIWKMSENGVSLISDKEAEKIHKELFKPRPRRKENK